MVITRTQAKRGRSSDDDDDSSPANTTPSSVSSSPEEKKVLARRGRGRPPAAKAAVEAGQRGEAWLESPVGVERLGRGCRVTQSTISLDEQYLAASLRRSATQQRSPVVYRGSVDAAATVPTKARHGKNDRGDEDTGAFAAVRSRYPQREAARRAMENLRSTLRHPNGASGRAGAGARDDEDSNSNSMGAFHFRHHPELAEEMRSGRSTRQRRRRRRRSGSDGDDGGSSSSSASSSSSPETSPSPQRRQSRLSTDTVAGAASAASPASQTATGGARWRRGAEPETASIDSSISDASMREESVERAAQQDRRADPSSSSSDDGEYMTEAQRRRAVRKARESVTENININHYMADAVGVADSRRIRRRQLDRRYRWLVHQEEDARAADGGSGSGSGGGGGSGGGAAGAATGNGALGDIVPLRVDDTITFDSVGGLPEHIVTLREMVLLPLLYPDVFERLDLKAPRGVLFVGPPGTGKTLMARALASEGARYARAHEGSDTSGGASRQHRITFFVRKGADMLSKWVGESERQLKLLFEEARRLQPSIIFFDEVDGLAPMRHAKAEQTQAALVSTLLALLDGLEDRGQVLVIGATNRPDTLDPALRRPGRFDRELVFPLPDAAARRHILTIHLARKAMPVGAAQRAALLEDLVGMTEGYSGADLGALCTEASLYRLRTALPQLYFSSQRLRIPRELEQTQLHVRTEDFYAAAQLMQPSLRRAHHSNGTGRRGGGGGAADAFLDPYIELLVRGTRDAVLAAVAPSWSLVDKALRAGARDCQDVVSAVRALCAVPIPQPPRPCLLVLREGSTQSWGDAAGAVAAAAAAAAAGAAAARSDLHHREQQRALLLHHLTISLLKGLPRLPQLTVHLPQLSWDDAAPHTTWRAGGAAVAPVADGYLGDVVGDVAGGGSSADFVDMRHVAESVRQCSPCVVYLSGVEEWLRGTGAVHRPAATSDTSADDHDDHDDVAHGADDPARVTRRLQRQVRTFRYYLNTMADTDVVFLLPCATAASCELLLGPLAAAPEPARRPSLPESLSPSSPTLQADPPSAVQLTRCSARQQLLHPQFSIVLAAVSPTPLPGDLRHYVQYVYRTVAMTLQLHHRSAPRGSAAEGLDAGAGGGSAAAAAAWATGGLALDHAPLASPLSLANERARRQADRAQRCALWRKVEYRRLQLRHVLMKWVSQYIHSGKFRLLASADLDLAADNPMHKAWTQHTRRHRVGLQDILERVEDEVYVCLSQFHDDIDQLVRNVRSFFRTRAAQDQRYRLRALDLKETCLLNMYKMNRTVIRFCEETRHLREPSSSSSEDEEMGDGNHDDGDAGGGGGEQRRARARRGGATPHSVEEALVSKDADPALLAEQSRRALIFTQRPAPPPRRKPRRYFGERRRRRRRPRQPTTVAKAEAQAETKDEVLLSDSDDTGSDGVAGEAPTASAADGGAPTTPVADAEEVAVAHTAASVQEWAHARLSSLSYTRLYQLFKSVMRGLEVEARQLECGASTVLRRVEAEAGHDSRGGQAPSEVYVVEMFRLLVLHALGE
ncbi:ATPase [Novymonas esmeraldas]|uniref:ATPase n=1 Tax=Novymonas esmeraldas TaxID=1808958 RepID=A0AAW0EIK4_9TRYP